MRSREEIFCVSKEYLLRTFSYKDGVLFRIGNEDFDNSQRWGRNKDGYVHTKVKTEIFDAHRLVWIMHNGFIKHGMVIDHIDGVRDNNKIENLRVVTRSENLRNRNGEIVGQEGILWHARDKMWAARIYVKKKSIHLGSYKNMKDAVKARRGAESLLAAIGFEK